MPGDQSPGLIPGAGLLIYGVTGYTGELVARRAHAEGLRPILAGRRGPEVKALAGELGCPHRVFPLTEPARVSEGLEDVRVVLHCAGPYAETWEPMAEACLQTGTHYLDVNADVRVFEALARLDQRALDRGVMLLGGVGFDVVPSDCLAAHLARQLPGAVRLELAFQTTGVSRGTALTSMRRLGEGGLVRRGGTLVRVPAAWRSSWVDLGEGPVLVTTLPWGDLHTAHVSTGIPDIQVSVAATGLARASLILGRNLGALLGTPLAQALLARLVHGLPPGPSAAQRARGRSLLWGRVSDAAGRSVEARLRGPEAYDLTAATALRIAGRALRGEAPAGYQTPATAYGADLILEVEGISRV